MHEVLQRVITALGIAEETGALAIAAAYSQAGRDEAMELLLDRVPVDGADIDVVVTGSFARDEASGESDFDYLVIPHSLPDQGQIRQTQRMMAAVDEYIAKASGLDRDPSRKKPGATGLFGQIQSATDLVERIGLEQDTNASHTRRVLLLQESASIYRPELHRRLVESIVARYLADYETPKAGPPRFLLNDLTRYWYTVAVDYQAKRWQRREAGWGIRYLKLLVSRRISYSSAAITLLTCGTTMPASVDRLTDQFAMPPLARIAQLHEHDHFDQQETLKRVLVNASQFISMLSQEQVRTDLDAVRSRADADRSRTFNELHQISEQVGADLREIMLGSLLGDATRTYLLL